MQSSWVQVKGGAKGTPHLERYQEGAIEEKGRGLKEIKAKILKLESCFNFFPNIKIYRDKIWHKS